MELSGSLGWWARLFVKNLVIAFAVNAAFVLLELEGYPGPVGFAVRTLVWGVLFLGVDLTVKHFFGELPGDAGPDR